MQAFLGQDLLVTVPGSRSATVGVVLGAPEWIGAASASTDGPAPKGRALGVVRGEQDTKSNLLAQGSGWRLQDGQIGNDNGDELLTDCPLAAGNCAFRTGLEETGMSALIFLLFSEGDWAGRHNGGRSYTENGNSTDDGCYDDEEDSTEQHGQGNLLLEAEVDSPEELFEVFV